MERDIQLNEVELGVSESIAPKSEKLSKAEKARLKKEKAEQFRKEHHNTKIGRSHRSGSGEGVKRIKSRQPRYDPKPY